MKVFLMCNAHIDPLWQWNWEEGAAEALSTFRCAAEFCEKFDGFVFNHNEALIYEYVEKYDSELFLKIKELIKKGKWNVIGGWYLQPDCNMPCGESIISQIEIGKEYFKNKFGVTPEIAMNIDSFGHSRGLVQILNKCGYNGYLFMRPMDGEINLPGSDFLWKGYDGSEIVGMRYPTWYNTNLGQSVERINEIIKKSGNKENVMVLWGMGDHGGGPSKKDLEEIKIFADEMKFKGIEIIHSTVDAYLDTVDKKMLPEYDRPLHHSMPGCYASMSRVKRAHRELENEIFITKSICSIANKTTGYNYPAEEIKKAMTDLCFSEFHDLLPGTCIEDAMNWGLNVISHGKRVLGEIKIGAFIDLCKNQSKPQPDTVPIFVYNPFPFEVETEVSCEFMLQNQNHNDKMVWLAEVFDQNGNKILSQQEKERSNINLDWRKCIAFEAKLSPMSMSRFDCKLKLLPVDYRDYDWRGLPNKLSFEGINEDIIFKNGNNSVTVSKNGLVSSWIIDGVEMVSGHLGKFSAYSDTSDPWGMEEYDFSSEPKGKFKLASPDEVAEICGFNHLLPPVRVIENGDLRTVIESIWKYNKSYVVAKCIVPQHLKYVDMEYNLFMAEKDTLIKTEFSPKLSKEKIFSADDMFGNRIISEMGVEQPIQKWIALSDDEHYFAVINKGQYSADCVDNKIRLTMLRTSAYTAHPTDGGVPTVMQTRYSPRMDGGEHSISIRMIADKKSSYDKLTNASAVFNASPYSLAFFPDGKPSDKRDSISIDDNSVVLSNIEIKENGLLLRLFNPTSKNKNFKLKCFDAIKEIKLNSFSFETFVYKDGTVNLTDTFGNLCNNMTNIKKEGNKNYD